METYEEYIQKKEKGVIPKSLWNHVKPIHFLVLFILIYVVHRIIVSSQEGQNNTLIYLILGALVVLYIVSLFKQSQDKGPIPRHIAQEIAKRDLQIEIDGDRSYPHGTKVIPTAYFKDQTHDNGDGQGPKLNKYNIGFLIRIPGRSDKKVRYQMNPFTGDCKGIIDASIGWEGEDVKDIQVILPDKIIEEKK